MKQTILLMAAVLFAVNAETKAGDFAQAFEQAMAKQAKIDFDTKAVLEHQYPGSTVWASNHHVAVIASFGTTYKGDLKLHAKSIAVWALIENGEQKPQYFEGSFSDARGEAQIFIDQINIDEQNPHNSSCVIHYGTETENVSDIFGVFNEIENAINHPKPSTKRSQSMAAAIAQAEEHLQDLWNKIPISTKGEIREAELEWIKKKDATSGVDKLRMIEDRSVTLQQK